VAKKESIIKTELISIDEIQNNPDNPRVLKDDKFRKLVQSIKDFPKMLEIRPIVVNSEMIVLGGNMRLKACKEAGLSEIPVIKASDLTEEQQKEFIIKDNVGFGEWDWELINFSWNSKKLTDWGFDLPVFFEDSEDLGTDFIIPSGEKNPFQQMSFILADEQAEQVRKAIEEIKKTDDYINCETMGNENTNGNAIYLIILQWAEQKK
jgi:hypothetical protein